MRGVQNIPENSTIESATVRNRVWTLDELRRVHAGDATGIALAETGGSPFRPNDPLLKFTEKLDFQLASTQPKKEDEIRAPLSLQTKNIILSNAVSSLGWWMSDPELSGTYVGNAAGKLLALIDRIYGHDELGGYRLWRNGMIAQGKDPDSLMYVLNDTGTSLDEDFRHEPEFIKSLHKGGPGTWPGPEIGPILDAHTGVTGFYGDLKKMVLRKQANGERVNLNGHDEVTYLIFKPAARLEDIKVFSFEARVPIEFQIDPVAYAGEVLTSQHFMKLRGDHIPAALRRKTLHEAHDAYFQTYGPMAQAMTAFFDQVSVPKTVRLNFGNAANADRMPRVISSQNNIQPPSLTPGMHIDMLLPPNSKINMDRHDYTEPDSLHRLTRDSDAVVLQEHSSEVLKFWDKHFPALLDLWCSLLVKKQVCVETMHKKPLIVLNRKDGFYQRAFSDGALNWDDPETERVFLKYLDEINPSEDPWLKFMMLTRYLHEKNFVKQQEHHLFTQVDPSKDDVGEILHNEIEAARGQYLEVPSYTRQEYGKDQHGMFEVFIAGSAGTHAQDYLEKAEALAYWAASQGFHIRTGGGNFGIMGAAARGVLKFMEDHPDRAQSTYLSLIQTFRTIQFEGAALNPKDIPLMKNIYMAIEETFDARMDSLLRTGDNNHAANPVGVANVFMAPGIGTVQELARLVRLKEEGAPNLQGQKAIVYNQRQAGDTEGRQIGVADAAMGIFPKKLRSRHFQVETELDGVKQAILQRHAEWQFKTTLAMGRAAVSSSRDLHL